MAVRNKFQSLDLHSPRSLGDEPRYGKFDSQTSLQQNSLFFESSNFKVSQAQRLAENEKKRVELHKKAREKAIDIASEKKAYQVLNDKKMAQNERNYKKYLREKEDELKLRMEEASLTRKNKYHEVKQHVKKVEGVSVKAHVDHIEEIKEKYRSRRKQDEEEAKFSYDRTHRDMSIKAKQHQDLAIKLDEEAQESRLHLASLQADIQKKEIGHNASIERMRLALLDKFAKDEMTYKHHLSIDQESAENLTLKVIDHANAAVKKAKKAS